MLPIEKIINIDPTKWYKLLLIKNVHDNLNQVKVESIENLLAGDKETR